MYLHMNKEFTVVGPGQVPAKAQPFRVLCGSWTKEGSVGEPQSQSRPEHPLTRAWMTLVIPRVIFPPSPRREDICGGAGLDSMWGCCGAAWTHLWVQGLPALLWDHDIQGVPEHRGDQWNLEAPGDPGGRLGQADRWVLELMASAGEQLTVQFVL